MCVPISRRALLANAGARLAAGGSNESPFLVRTTQECGWNVFVRKGSSTDPKDIALNRTHLDFLREAGLNWLLVFWTNAPEFNDVWQQAVDHARSIGLKLGRSVYGFGGGGAETTMAEPNVPRHLLRPSKIGTGTAMCPHDPETREWVAKALAVRVQPDIDGILIEPAREAFRNCICERCRALRPFEWDTFIINFMADHLLALKPGIEIMLHLNVTGNGPEADRAMAADLAGLRKPIRHIFAWGTDDERSLVDWLDADPRFCPYIKYSRCLLFPDGAAPAASAAERAGKVFRWARLAAERGKKAYSYDWRIFGGTEWQGHKKSGPATRLCRRMPASIALMGAAMQDPYMAAPAQRKLLERLRKSTEWDLDDPKVFYLGAG